MPKVTGLSVLSARATGNLEFGGAAFHGLTGPWEGRQGPGQCLSLALLAPFVRAFSSGNRHLVLLGSQQ